jgi:hypothetical protein
VCELNEIKLKALSAGDGVKVGGRVESEGVVNFKSDALSELCAHAGRPLFNMSFVFVFSVWEEGAR